jgi:hypothetical protein
VTFIVAKTRACAVRGGSTQTFSHPWTSTTISRITKACIHITTQPAERFSRRVLQFEHLPARFYTHPTCHSRFCASPLRPASLRRRDCGLPAEVHHSHSPGISCTTTPHDNDIVAHDTRLSTPRDALSPSLLRPSLRLTSRAPTAFEVFDRSYRLLFALHNTHTNPPSSWRQFNLARIWARASCPAA